jgi:pimeloyl-ACP methyl ester carboxylesterase
MTELYWLIRSRLELWAQVAAYDPPGVGAEPARAGPLLAGIARRGLEELDRQGGDRWILVADGYGAPAAVELAGLARERVAGLALGHATLSYHHDGPRPAIDPTVESVATRMMELNYRGWVRQDLAVWDVRRDRPGESAPEGLLDRIVSRVPASVGVALSQRIGEEGAAYGSLEGRLRQLDLPLLLAKHEGCVTFTDAGFADAVVAFPGARTVHCNERPAVSGDFAEALREFCASIA